MIVYHSVAIWGTDALHSGTVPVWIKKHVLGVPYPACYRFILRPADASGLISCSGVLKPAGTVPVKMRATLPARKSSAWADANIP